MCIRDSGSALPQQLPLPTLTFCPFVNLKTTPGSCFLACSGWTWVHFLRCVTICVQTSFYNTRYAVKYYQLGAFLASTEAHWSYNWPIIIHALNQDASTGVGGVGKAPVLLSVEFAPYRVPATSSKSWKQRITGLIKKIPYAVNFALLIDSDQLCSY